MSSISGLISLVSIIIVIAVASILFRERYLLQKDYTDKIEDIVRQINDINEVNATYEKKQDDILQENKQYMTNIDKNYVTHSNLQKELKTN